MAALFSTPGRRARQENAAAAVATTGGAGAAGDVDWRGSNTIGALAREAVLAAARRSRTDGVLIVNAFSDFA